MNLSPLVTRRVFCQGQGVANSPILGHRPMGYHLMGAHLVGPHLGNSSGAHFLAM